MTGVRRRGRPSPRRWRRRWLWATGTLAAAVTIFVLVWFQPQKLVVDDRVDDRLPARADADDPGLAAPPASNGGSGVGAPDTVATGSFTSLDHHTTGTVQVLDVGGGARVVRLEGLDTSNGPDLYVYLSTNPAVGDEGAFDDDHVNLGRLMGNLGNQNYELPAGTDLTRYRTVVIWCDRFDSAFGAADLVPVP